MTDQQIYDVVTIGLIFGPVIALSLTILVEHLSRAIPPASSPAVPEDIQ